MSNMKIKIFKIKTNFKYLSDFRFFKNLSKSVLTTKLAFFLNKKPESLQIK